MRWILVTAALLVLGACAGSMGKGECKTADWRAIGFEDGSRGAQASTFGKRRKACAEHGIAANFDMYRAGHAEGLTIYCRPQNGYALGTRGSRYGGACPAHLDRAFRTANADGYGLYERRVVVNNIARQISANRRRLETIDRQIQHKTLRSISSATPPIKRARMILDIRDLAEEKVRVQNEIPRLEYEHEQAQRAFEGYRSSVANRY